MKEEESAILKINKASEMTFGRKKEIAEWLRKQAKDLLKEGDNYAKVYRAKFYL